MFAYAAWSVLPRVRLVRPVRLVRLNRPNHPSCAVFFSKFEGKTPENCEKKHFFSENRLAKSEIADILCFLLRVLCDGAAELIHTIWFFAVCKIEKLPVLKKNRKNFKIALAKIKIDDILCFCCASKATMQRGWYKAENFADREIEKLPVLKKIEKNSKNDLQSKKSVIY